MKTLADKETGLSLVVIHWPKHFLEDTSKNSGLFSSLELPISLVRMSCSFWLSTLLDFPTS